MIHVIMHAKMSHVVNGPQYPEKKYTMKLTAVTVRRIIMFTPPLALGCQWPVFHYFTKIIISHFDKEVNRW